MDKELKYCQTLYVRNWVSNSFIIHYRVIGAMLWLALYLMVQASFPLYYNILYASHWALFLTTLYSCYNAIASLEITRPHFKKYDRLRYGYFFYQLAFSFNVITSLMFWLFLKDQLLAEHPKVYQKALLLMIHTVPVIYFSIGEVLITRVAFYEPYFVHAFVLFTAYMLINMIAVIDDQLVLYRILKWNSMEDFYMLGLIYMAFTGIYYLMCRVTKDRIEFALKDPNINLL